MASLTLLDNEPKPEPSPHPDPLRSHRMGAEREQHADANRLCESFRYRLWEGNFCDTTLMRPAFSSTRQAAAFALMLLLLLLSPALAKKFLPPREEIYSSIWWVWGDFPYMDGQIFRQQGDVDIAFMGASHLWAAFDTPAVQEQLSRELGRPAVARTFGWAWPGYDPLYSVAQDLMEHRRVRLLVFDDDCGEMDAPHPLAPHLFRFGEDAEALDGLPASFQADYYYAAIAGAPRNLLALVRTNLPADLDARSYWEIHGYALNVPSRLGAIAARESFDPHGRAPFVAYHPVNGVQPSDVCIYSRETKAPFAFSSAGLPPMQLYFARKLAALARQHGCRLVVVHIPTFDERRSPVISMPAFWPDALRADVTMIGIPPATLFKGLSDDEIRRLYANPLHLNKNGQDYFTALMTPNLLKIYESQNH